MKIIDRYMLKEYLVPFGYVLGSFCMLYIVLDLFERFPNFVEAKVPILDVFVYYGYYLFAVNGFVPFIVVILPIALLLAALYTLTMFARHNELTAMCASGVSVRRLMTPLMTVGFCASLFGAITQETIGPFATRWAEDYEQRVLKGRSESVAVVRDYLYHAGEAHRQWLLDRFNKRDPARFKGVKVLQEREDGSLMTEIIARRAEWLDGKWWFYEMQSRPYNEAGEPAGPLSPPSENPVEMSEFAETPTDMLNEIQKSDFLSSWDMIQSLRARPNLSGAARARREVDIYARIAMPWACMVLILLSLPATAGGVRRPALRSVAFGLAALFGFYVIVQTGMILGKREIIWPWLAGWLPNIVFLVIGGALTSRLK
jgi:lipopolysaccharide export system permease protein